MTFGTIYCIYGSQIVSTTIIRWDDAQMQSWTEPRFTVHRFWLCPYDNVLTQSIGTSACLKTLLPNALTRGSVNKYRQTYLFRTVIIRYLLLVHTTACKRSRQSRQLQKHQTRDELYNRSTNKFRFFKCKNKSVKKQTCPERMDQANTLHGHGIIINWLTDTHCLISDLYSSNDKGDCVCELLPKCK